MLRLGTINDHAPQLRLHLGRKTCSQPSTYCTTAWQLGRTPDGHSRNWHHKSFAVSFMRVALPKKALSSARKDSMQLCMLLQLIRHGVPAPCRSRCHHWEVLR